MSTKLEIMNEFARLVAEEDKVKTAAAKNPYAEDKKVIEEKRLFPDEDIVEIAHPEPVYIAESRGDGGLVENQNEQHEKMMEVINKMPTGALLGTYASTVTALIKMADACDEINETEAADLLTDAAKKISELVETHPFEKALAK